MPLPLRPPPKIPYLGLCLGMQAAVSTSPARSSNEEANSTEFNAFTAHPVIDLLPEQRDIEDKGGTMRLGVYPCKLVPGTKAAQAYGETVVYERHRHRYEFNNHYREQLAKAGVVFTGTSPTVAWSRSSNSRTIPSSSARSSIPSSARGLAAPSAVPRVHGSVDERDHRERHGRRRRVQQRRAERVAQHRLTRRATDDRRNRYAKLPAHRPVAPSFDQMTEALSMIPTRAVLALPAAALVLSGCGAVSTLTLRATTESVAYADTTQHLPRPAVTSTSVAPGLAGAIVVTIPATGDNEWLEIVNASGTVVTKTLIDPSSPWLTAAGAGGAYWTQGGEEHELTTSGAVRAIGAVPADANGVVIGPDGTSYAYTTSEQLKNGTALNEIVVVRPGAPAAVIADRISDPNHPTADAPESWDYYLINWTADGIAFARVMTGGCGCGSFDMQMQSANSAIINPSTEVVTALTNDDFCRSAASDREPRRCASRPRPIPGPP